MTKRALISVSDKTGIVELAQDLHRLGVEIISTGGTAKLIAENDIPVTKVSDLTGYPECLDGRVKTLHPVIHGGLLARRDLPSHMDKIKELGIKTIDIVVINLYPFKETISKPDVKLEDAIENIDIGGPTMLRSAAKNHQDVLVCVDPRDYKRIIESVESGKSEYSFNYELALKVFEHTAAYDALICRFLRERSDLEKYPEKMTLTFEKVQDLRYGENPHQSSAFYQEPIFTEGTLVNAEQLHGKELSFNNINDANGALELLKEYSDPTVVAVKHTNACGVGTGYNIHDAYVKAHDCDPISIFGGIVASNRKIDLETAKEISKIFVELVIAPDFEQEALDLLMKKKNVRIMKLDNIGLKQSSNAMDVKKVNGGLLVQDINDKEYDKFEVVTDRIPTEKEVADMKFAWKVCKHIKSNGIVLAKDGQTVGIGPGQTNRIWAVENAVKQALVPTKGTVMASDAFFPFKDCVEAAAKAGITAIIQPGGSMRDEESIAAANEYGIAMVFTGTRHFKH